MRFTYLWMTRKSVLHKERPAESVSGGISPSGLMGCIAHQKPWLEEALEEHKDAVDPNLEKAAAERC